MKPRSEKQHKEALAMRKSGKSIRDIEIALEIPRSTLSGWLKDVELSPSQRKVLLSKNRMGLTKARVLAAKAHKDNKLRRIESVNAAINSTLRSLPTDDMAILELALAMLYFGEGSKTKQGLRLGNSDPRIIHFYVDSLKKLYGLTENSLYFALHLRADQDVEKEKIFWSQALDMPVSNFRYHIKDLRTAGKPTRPGYHGVCLAQGGPVEIQRRLMYLSEAFCERVKRG